MLRPSNTLMHGRDYSNLLGGVSELFEITRSASARAVNALMTATYWEIGRRIIEFEQGGAKHAEYGEEVLKRLVDCLTGRFGCGFSRFTFGGRWLKSRTLAARFEHLDWNPTR